MAGWDDPAHRLDAERLDGLFAQLDSQAGRLKPPGSGRLDMLICGGAAMCYQIGHRGTGDVDVMFPPLPAWLREAVRVVARRRNVDSGWFNDAVAQTATYQPPAVNRTLFEGDHIKILAPHNKFLLGMKVLAARDEDQEDALWLMQDTGMCSESDLREAALSVSLAAGAPWDPSQRQFAFLQECVMITRRATAAKASGAAQDDTLGAGLLRNSERGSPAPPAGGAGEERPGALRRFAGRLARVATRLVRAASTQRSPLCCRTVRSTGRPCRLRRGHRGRCRSAMPSDP